MTDDTQKKVQAAYSALPREEPRAAIDDAILAASRRALARPPAASRWAMPASIAAVLVLAFGVTLNMREEKPGVELPDLYTGEPASPPAAAEPPAPARASTPKESVAELRAQAVPETVAPAPQKKTAPKAKLDAMASRAREESDRPVLRDEAERKDLASRAAPAEAMLQKDADATGAATSALATPPPPVAAAAARMKREAAPTQAPAAVSADSQARVDEPTRELEAIAKLRAEGRHEEADRSLAQFRRSRPDYRIPEAMWERVRPR